MESSGSEFWPWLINYGLESIPSDVSNLVYFHRMATNTLWLPQVNDSNQMSNQTHWMKLSLKSLLVLQMMNIEQFPSFVLLGKIFDNGHLMYWRLQNHLNSAFQGKFWAKPATRCSKPVGVARLSGQNKIWKPDSATAAKKGARFDIEILKSCIVEFFKIGSTHFWNFSNNFSCTWTFGRFHNQNHMSHMIWFLQYHIVFDTLYVAKSYHMTHIIWYDGNVRKGPST